MSDVILVLLRRPERVNTLLNAATRLGSLMGQACVNALAVREPIQVAGLAAEALIGEADAVLDAREHERERVAAVERLSTAGPPRRAKPSRPRTGSKTREAPRLSSASEAAAPTSLWSDGLQRTTDWPGRRFGPLCLAPTDPSSWCHRARVRRSAAASLLPGEMRSARLGP
jgi:hypothetical protein